MNYKYRVTLEGIKGFYRLYLTGGASSLYTFHKQLQSDLEFPADQPILFKALDADGGVVARYALVDLGFGTVDAVKIADTVKAGARKLIYFYDVTARKYVIITLEEETSEAVTTPKLLESKGPIPLEFENGYVAFEDMPEDRRRLPGEHRHNDDEDNEDEDFNEDEDEDDEDEDEDEEEEIIYDENEGA